MKITLALITACFALPAAAQDRVLPLRAPIMLGADTGTLYRLVQRPDVQNELRLDLKQKHALTEMESKNGPPGRIQIRASGEPGRNIEDEIRSQIAQRFTGIESQLAEILKPEQMARLKELDLQYRGAIALGDARVSEQVKIRQTTRAEILKLVSAYNQERSRIIFEHSQVDDRSDGGNRVMRMVKAPDMSNPLSPVRKKLDPLKKEAEEKILALLNDEETANWRRIQGEKFTFRSDLPANRRTRP